MFGGDSVEKVPKIEPSWNPPSTVEPSWNPPRTVEPGPGLAGLPALTPEQLSYLQLLQARLGPELARPEQLVTRSWVQDTTLTLTESTEYTVRFRNQPVTTTVLSTRLLSTRTTVYTTLTRTIPG